MTEKCPTDPLSVVRSLHARVNTEYGARPSYIMGTIINRLCAEGENLNPTFCELTNDEKLIGGLIEAAEARNIDPIEFIRHSNRYSNIDRFSGLFDKSQPVTIAASSENLLQNGKRRREESGHRLSLGFLRQKEIDPKMVLYYRVTQLSDVPKPEYYWTSDFAEVSTGLAIELGQSSLGAVILVSTLEEIASNGGLINDINDDCGIAVRQIGLGNFDQKQALLIIPRQ